MRRPKALGVSASESRTTNVSCFTSKPWCSLDDTFPVRHIGVDGAASILQGGHSTTHDGQAGVVYRMPQPLVPNPVVSSASCVLAAADSLKAVSPQQLTLRWEAALQAVLHQDGAHAPPRLLEQRRKTRCRNRNLSNSALPLWPWPPTWPSIKQRLKGRTKRVWVRNGPHGETRRSHLQQGGASECFAPACPRAGWTLNRCTVVVACAEARLFQK